MGQAHGVDSGGPEAVSVLLRWAVPTQGPYPRAPDSGEGLEGDPGPLAPGFMPKWTFGDVRGSQERYSTEPLPDATLLCGAQATAAPVGFPGPRLA